MPAKSALWSPLLGDVAPSTLDEWFGSAATGLVNTNITTAGNGTLTAAGLVGGQITRTGPTAAFTDTTDTAAAIVSSLGGSFVSGATFLVALKNLTTWPMTVSAGTGITWSGVTVIPPYTVGYYFGTLGGTSASPTVTFAHTSTVPAYMAGAVSNPQGVALSTVGAGTITAAGIAAGVTLRSGSTSAFTDTTDTADAIIAAFASSSMAIGASFEYTYVNNTVAAATIGGGTGVTVSGITVVPANSWATYLVTYTAADTVTMVGIAQGFFPKSGTVTANQATPVAVSDTRVTAGSNIILTYSSGTTGATGAFVSSRTPGTGFSIKSVTTDTAVYTYVILG